MQGFIAIFLIALCVSRVMPENVWPAEEETAEFWLQESENELETALLVTSQLNTNKAKNVIMFLGDGMGMPTITAGRILKGQLRGGPGEEYSLAMDKFPHVGISRTYSIDKQTPDSAATATAFLSGVKTMDATIGFTGKVRRGDCSSGPGNEVESILIDSYKAGKSTGIVSTTQLTHATVAAPYAHSVDRDWYTDSDMPDEAKDAGCVDIARQFLNQSDKITVALGGGRAYFRGTENSDDAGLGNGRRSDGRDLIQEWLDAAVPSNETRKYVWNREQILALHTSSTDRLWGMFQPKHMSYEIDRDHEEEPSVAEMVEKAIQILNKNGNGYFLIVEGGRIDHGHHDSSATQALHDMVAFDDAIQKAVDMVSAEDTLIVVTADHGHTMSIGGYADRGTSVFGLAPPQNIEIAEKPATTILYGDGPGFVGNGTLEAVNVDPNSPVIRENVTLVDTAARSYQQQSAVPRYWESHTADDVAIFARGPMSHLFHGVHQQSYIAHVMRYASCVGLSKTVCTGIEEAYEDSKDDSFEIEKAGNCSDDAVWFLGHGLTNKVAMTVLYVEFAMLLCLAIIVLFVGVLAARHRSE